MLAVPNPGIIASYRISGLPPATPATASADWSIRSLCGVAGNVSITDVEFATSAGGPNIATGGTGYGRQTTFNPSSTFGVDGAMFDGDLSTFRNSAAHDLMEAAYEFSTTQIIREVRIIAHGSLLSFAQQSPLGFLVSVSYNGRATWLPVAAFSTPNTWTVGESRAFAFDPTVFLTGLGRSAARAWRVVINGWALGSNPRIGDLAFAASSGGPTLCSGGAAVCNISAFSQNPNDAFDGNISTYWNGAGVGVLGQRLGYVFPTLVNAQELRMTASTAPNQTPTDFDVQWSNDLDTWTTALTVTGLSWSSSETKTWVIP